jgi:hypothetical protein
LKENNIMPSKKKTEAIKGYLNIERPLKKDEAGNLVPAPGAYDTELCLMVKGIFGDRISKTGKPYTLAFMASAKDQPALLVAVYTKTGEDIRDAVGHFIEAKTDRDAATGAKYAHARTFINTETMADGSLREKQFVQVYRFTTLGVAV